MAGIGIAKRGLGLLAKGGRAGFKRAGPVTKADIAKRDLWRKRILKKRSKVGQRKSKWDVHGAITGHPLNPFRVHAAGKATDWSSMRKDVYGRTRDDLKKSRDPEVKKVAEGFQKMDWKDEARSDPRYTEGSKFYKEHQPKLTKRTHVGRKTGGPIPPIDLPWPKPGDVPTKKRKRRAKGGRIGLKQGGAYLPLRGTGGAGVAKAFRGEQGFKQSQALQSRIVKGAKNPSRMDQAKRLRAHRLRTKIHKARAGRAKQAQQEAGTARLYARHPEAKTMFAKQKFGRQFKKAGKR